jgi:ribosomal protein S18 acetylase RimI-like enzyme
MGELGTHLAIERASVGNSPPKVIRAALLPDADCPQRPLRCRFQPRLTPGVRRHHWPEGDNIDVRLATLNDAEIISALNAEVQTVHAEALPHLFKAASPETFPTSFVRPLLADPDTYIFIGSLHDEPVGYLYAQIIRRQETALRHAWERLHIHHISVHRTQHRRGCGHALLQAAVQFAKEQGITTITLDVWSFNTQARSFFATQGFTVYNENMWLEVSGQE